MINKRYLHNIKDNFAFYISAIALTIVALLLFFIFNIAGTGIKDYGDKFFKEHNLEDASITLYQDIDDSNMQTIEDKFNVEFEKEEYINVEEKNYTVRLFNKTKKIDKYEIINGRDIKSNDEVIISAGYFDANNLKLNDEITISNKQYKIVGTFLRPDYLYMLENVKDDYKNITTFFLAYVSNEEFLNNYSSYSTNYKVVYNSKSNKKEFREYLNDNYTLINYLSKDDNARITFVDEQANMFLLCSYILLVILPFITVLLISIILGRKIKSEQKIIGTLSAFGYSKKSLIMHYSIMAIIPGLIGGILMSIIIKIVEQPFGSICLADYEPMQATFTLPIPTILLGIIIPTLIYFIAAALKVRKLLKKETVLLLNANYDNSKKINKAFLNSKLNVKLKFSLRELLKNYGRSIVIFLGIFLGTLVISFGYSFIDSVNSTGVDATNQMGKFKNEYILNTYLDDSKYGNETMMFKTYEDKNNKTFTLYGATNEIKLFNIEDSDNNKVDLDKGYYVSTLMALIRNINVGDEVEFTNPSTQEKYKVKIIGIVKNNYSEFIISNKKDVSKIIDIKENQYNIILSNKKEDIDNSLIYETVNKDTFTNQMDTILDEMGPMIYVLFIIGAVICIASIYSIINMLIEENRNNISMLKVLGYRKKEINLMLLSSNHLLLIPGIIAGELGAYYMMYWYSYAFAETEKMLFVTKLYFSSCIYVAIIVIASYTISLLLVRNKVDKVDMVEALKDNRE